MKQELLELANEIQKQITTYQAAIKNWKWAVVSLAKAREEIETRGVPDSNGIIKGRAGVYGYSEVNLTTTSLHGCIDSPHKTHMEIETSTEMVLLEACAQACLVAVRDKVAVLELELKDL